MTVLEVMIVVLFSVWVGRRLQLYKLKVPIIQINEVAERAAQVQSPKSKVQSPRSQVQSLTAQLRPPCHPDQRGGISEGVWRSIHFVGYGRLILLFLIAATVSVFVSADKVAALGIWKAYFIEPVLFFVVLTQTLAKPGAKPREGDDQLSSTSINFHQLFTALGLSGLFVAIPAIVQKFTAWGIANPFWAAEETRRVVSWYGFPNAVGLYLAPVVVMMVGWWWYRWTNQEKVTDVQIKGTDNTDEKNGGDIIIGASRGEIGSKRKKFFIFLIFCFLVFLPVLAIVFARSEGATVGLAVGLVALIFGLAGGRARWGIGLIGLICLMGLIAYAPARQLIMENATLSDLSGQIRVQQWKETWNMLKDGRLITGAGLAGYQIAIKPYHREGIFYNFDNDPNFRNNLVFGGADYKAKHWQPTEIYLYPHNFFLNFWSETGLLGLIAILLILIKFFTDYLRTDEARRPLYLILISVMIAIVVHGLVDVQYFKNDLSVLFWLVVGMSVVVKGEGQRAEVKGQKQGQK